jgi:hypothetical protein
VKEDEVKENISNWFKSHSYSVFCDVKSESGNKIDLLAKSKDEEWFVETKGDYSRTESYQVDFDTGMGQLLKSITRLDGKTKYAIAIPFSSTERQDRFSYRLILPKYSKSLVFEKLNIHLILVRDDKSVEIIEPDKVIGFLSNRG